MTVHSFHVFDRKGKTLFTKNYAQASRGPPLKADPEEEERLSEQRKLVFGMLFSLREMCGTLSPIQDSDRPNDVQMVKTGASCLYNYETVSGLKFAIYTTPETAYGTTSSSSAGGTGGAAAGSGSQAQSSTSHGGTGGSTSVHGGTAGSLASAQEHSGMTSVTVNANIREALRHIYEKIWVAFVVRSPMYDGNNPDVASTNFEAALDHYLRGMVWFR